MKRTLAAGAIAMLLAACGGAASTPATSTTLGSGPPPASPSAGVPSGLSSSASISSGTSVSGPASAAGVSSRPATQAVQVFFTAGSKLVAESEPVSTEDPTRAAVELLIKGPKDSDHYSDVPTSTQLQSISIKDGTALVSFGASFFSSTGSTGMQMRLAQVVYTLTQFPNVTAVQFLQDGRPATVAGGEGFPLNRPLTRKSLPVVQA